MSPRKDKEEKETITLADVEAKLSGMSKAERERLLSRLELKMFLDKEKDKPRDGDLYKKIMGTNPPRKK